MRGDNIFSLSAGLQTALLQGRGAQSVKQLLQQSVRPTSTRLCFYRSVSGGEATDASSQEAPAAQLWPATRLHAAREPGGTVTNIHGQHDDREH